MPFPRSFIQLPCIMACVACLSAADSIVQQSRAAGTLPSGRLESFLGASGISNVSSQADLPGLGVGWVRVSIDWGDANPSPGVYDWTAGDKLVTDASALNLRVVLMIRNTPRWAAVTSPYSFTTIGNELPGIDPTPHPQRWTVTPTLDGSGLPDGYTTTIADLDGSVLTVQTSSHPDLRMADPDASWRPFIRALVGRYSQPPFNVAFYEICNEHRPESGQYPQDAVESVAQRWFVPGAQEVHRFPGCRVMNCWGTSVASSQMDAFDAVPGVLEQLDIVNQHYGDWQRWPQMFARYAAKGRPDIAFWATEYGGGTNVAMPWKVSHSYPAILYECLGHQWDWDDKFKVFWWPASSPPTLTRGLHTTDGAITRHGQSVQTLYTLLHGSQLERWSGFAMAPDPAATDLAVGFRTDRGYVLAIGLLGSAPGQIFTVDLPGLTPGLVTLARCVDALGTITETPAVQPIAGGTRVLVDSSRRSDPSMQTLYIELQVAPEPPPPGTGQQDNASHGGGSACGAGAAAGGLILGLWYAIALSLNAFRRRT